MIQQICRIFCAACDGLYEYEGPGSVSPIDKAARSAELAGWLRKGDRWYCPDCQLQLPAASGVKLPNPQLRAYVRDQKSVQLRTTIWELLFMDGMPLIARNVMTHRIYVLNRDLTQPAQTLVAQFVLGSMATIERVELSFFDRLFDTDPTYFGSSTP